MGRLIREMKRIYNVESVDLLGFSIEDEDRLSFHHLIKKVDGGMKSLNNGVPLGISHKYIHIIESKDLDLYIKINIILKEIVAQGYFPTKSQLMALNYMFAYFEKEHSGDKVIKPLYIENREKGLLLLKRDYDIEVKYE